MPWSAIRGSTATSCCSARNCRIARKCGRAGASRSRNIGRCSVRRSSTRSEEHTSERQSLMRTSYAVFCLKKKNKYHLTATFLRTLCHLLSYLHHPLHLVLVIGRTALILHPVYYI